MQVKRLQPDDARMAREAVAGLKLDGRAVPARTVESMRTFLTREENHLLVAIDDDQPVGFVLGYLLDRLDRDSPMMLLYEIGVAESHRRRGCGQALVKALRSIAVDKCVVKMWVLTNRSNSAAMALYRSTGGRENPDGDEVAFVYPLDDLE